MLFCYTWVCPKCCENRSNLSTISKRKRTCNVCGAKVIATKIYFDFVEGKLPESKDKVSNNLTIVSI